MGVIGFLEGDLGLLGWEWRLGIFLFSFLGFFSFGGVGIDRGSWYSFSV